MTEPTLLQQARQRLDMALEVHGVVRAANIGIALDRVLQYLEQRETAMRGPAQVPSEPKCKAGYPGCDCASFDPPGREPKCKGCGWERRRHNGHPEPHEFEPEMPDEEHVRLQRELAGMRGQFKSFDLDLDSTRRGKLDAPADLDLDELQKLCDAATPGKWEADDAGYVRDEDGDELFERVGPGRVADGRLVAAARDALPKLIELVRKVQPITDVVDRAPRCPKCHKSWLGERGHTMRKCVDDLFGSGCRNVWQREESVHG
jgi:hypothetical protein